MITNLEPDILECEVKWALESITRNKASGGDGIPVELFQILKDDAVKVLHSICQQVWNTEQWPPDWKRSVFIPIPKKGNAKECSNYCTIALISHASKVMLKILHARLQQYMNCELPDFTLDLEKAEEPGIKLPTSAGSSKKQEGSRKTSTSALLTTPKPLIVVDHNKLWKILKEMGIPDHLTCLLRNLGLSTQAKKQQLELDMEQQSGSKSRKEYVKAVYCHPAYLAYMQSTSCNMLGWMKHKLQ